MAVSAEKRAQLPAIVEDYSSGRYTLTQLQEKYGVDRCTIYQWMLSELGENHREVVTRCLVSRIAEADQELDDAADMLGVQKAREKMRYARFDYERRRPELYGPKQEVVHKTAPVLHIHTTAPQEKVIEGSHVPSALPAPSGRGE